MDTINRINNAIDEKGYVTEEELYNMLGCYTKEEFEKYMNNYKFRNYVVNAEVFTTHILEKVKSLIGICIGKDRCYLTNLLKENDLSANMLDPLLSYFGFTIR